MPAAQREVWRDLAPAAAAGLILYGGTAIALQLGHRESIDFDFFSTPPLDKVRLRASIGVLDTAHVLQDEPNTLVVSASLPSGPVKLSFFGGLAIGRVGDPRQTADGVLIVASLLDLMATKLKSILDRAEAKDYIDLAALIRSGVRLDDGLAAFRTLFSGEPAVALRAIGYFGDGDLSAVNAADRALLRNARDQARVLPEQPRRSARLT